MLVGVGMVDCVNSVDYAPCICMHPSCYLCLLRCCVYDVSILDFVVVGVVWLGVGCIIVSGFWCLGWLFVFGCAVIVVVAWVFVVLVYLFGVRDFGVFVWLVVCVWFGFFG